MFAARLFSGIAMHLYRSVADAIGTPAAIQLAHRLAAWHDAMVMHRRRAGDRRSRACGQDCPHDEAMTLWQEAVAVFGERAEELMFLRSHGGASRREATSAVTGIRG